MGMINKNKVKEYVEGMSDVEDLKFVIYYLFQENEKLSKENVCLNQKIDEMTKPSIDLKEMERQYKEYYSDDNLQY